MLRRASERIRQALTRCAFGIVTVALTYGVTVLVGMGLVHGGNRFALEFRDRLVGKAMRESPILHDLQKGNRLRAAGLDAAGNAAAAGTGLVAGYFPPGGYGLAAFRGWVGGVVSVDGDHRSRLRSPREALYYLTTLFLQLIPYTLAGGAGVNLGIASLTRRGRAVYQGRRMRWVLIPYEAGGDALWIYLVCVPLFVMASIFEFMMA